MQIYKHVISHIQCQLTVPKLTAISFNKFTLSQRYFISISFLNVNEKKKISKEILSRIKDKQKNSIKKTFILQTTHNVIFDIIYFIYVLKQGDGISKVITVLIEN